MSVHITGDTHGEFSRFSYEKWPEGKGLTGEDVVIVTGDFGLLWTSYVSDNEAYHIKWLNSKPWMTLFVDGNHEHHPRLSALPQKEMFGGTVGVVSDKIFHLRRGEIYRIQDKKFFVMGGADSIDKRQRTRGVSWWPEEVPSHAEMDYGLSNLEKHQYAIDYILSHTAPENVTEVLLQRYGCAGYDPDPTRKYLQHVCSTATFEKLYCGHWHEDIIISRYNFLYDNIVKVF